MSMFRSPHKRGIRVANRIKEYKTSVSGNRGGNSHRNSGMKASLYPDPQNRRLRGEGTKHVLVPRVANEPPGQMRGKHLPDRPKENPCDCGGCHAKRKRALRG